MMRAWRWSSVACVAFATIARTQTVRAGRIEFDTVHSAAIADNKYGDSPDREVIVYLPPSYDSSKTSRYPVLYLLHGFGSNDRVWMRGYRGFSIQPAMDSLVAAGAAREMIVVMPNARNRFGGSFFTNSASTGNWDDFISKELVSYVDKKFRTLARARSRGLAGHSMGGYGTFYLGMRHGGDIYGALYALSGCCTRFSHDLNVDTEEIWRRLESLATLADAQSLTFYPQVYLALSAAFSPNVNKPPLYVDFPFERKQGMWQPVPFAQDEWDAHAPYDMIRRSAERLLSLRGFAFDVGTHDQLVEPASLAAMDSAFTRAGILHSFETYDGDHTNMIGVRMITKVLPFFSRTLDFSDASR